MKKGAQMNLQTFRQNKKVFLMLLIFLYVGLLVIGHMLNLPDFLISIAAIPLFLTLFLIMFAGGVVFGYITKNRTFAAALGFLISVIMGVISALSVRMIDSAPQYPEFYFYQILTFVQFLLAGLFGAVAGWMAASHDENKTKRYVQYMLACIFLMISLYFMFNPDLVYWMFSILGL